MFRLTLFLCIFLLNLACNLTQTISGDKLTYKTESVKTNIESKPLPIKVSPEIKFTKKQTGELDKSLPASVREILENADTFEILAEVERKSGKIVYPMTEGFYLNPNVKADISDENLRKEILENFYRDVAKRSEAANCWQPHHILRAKNGDEIVEMKICFSCSKFEGKGSFGEFSGTTGRGDEKTENLFNHIIEKYGVDIR